jgi:glycosyltransferase involved in cell wall biosynthesis
MNLLLVFPFVPYPPDDGGRIGFWNPIRYLSRYHEIHIACLSTEEDRRYCDTVREHCASLSALHRSMPPKLLQAARGLVGFPPGTAWKYWTPRFCETIKQAITEHSIDIVEFHHLNTAAYRESAGLLPTILREHNVEHVVWERHARFAPLAERAYARWVAPRVRRYEAEVAPTFDRCVVVSPADAEHLRRVSPRAHIDVIPSGVDTEYFWPESTIEEEPNTIVLTGSFDWPPKRHNLRVILEQIMPRIRARIPDARLIVVGKGISREIESLAKQTPGVTIVGSVADVRPYVWRASLVLNYLESGGGIALKVLEALAMRKAVLSNQLGCEGIEVGHNAELFLADGPESMAAAAALLLGDRALRQRLAIAGFQMVLRKYAWANVAKQFDSLYSDLIADRDVAGENVGEIKNTKSRGKLWTPAPGRADG